jgi:hypothetical protein
LSGDTYSTRQRAEACGTGSNIRRSSAARKAARVLPEPVGARQRALSPRAMTGQPSACTPVGASNDAGSHALTGVRKPASAGCSIGPGRSAGDWSFGVVTGSGPWFRNRRTGDGARRIMAP